MTKHRLSTRVLTFLALLASTANLEAQLSPCTQTQIDGTTAPTTTSYIYPRVPLQPFYQWANNNGYCGEVDLMQAGLNNGQWMSQYDARLVCGSGLGQAGTCTTSKSTPNFNAQMLFEVPNTGVSGTTEAWSSMPVCAANMRLNALSYPYQGVAAKQPAAGCATTATASPANCPGYQAYMSWVKQQVINGSQVAVAIIIAAVDGGTGDQYDHEVPVVKIGTNHSPTDPTYYPDDVLYIEDHGNWNIDNNKTNATTYDAIPWGVNGTNNATSCTPYIFGYAFSALGMTDSQADKSKQAYEIILPANTSISTQTGGNGSNSVKVTGPNNYAVAVTGVMDSYGETVPVALTAGANPGSLVSSTTGGVANPSDPIAGLDYENPFVGTSTNGGGTGSCVNTPPTSWMSIVLQPTVSGLTPGVSYNLYEYQFNTPSNDTLGGDGTWAGTAAAALAVPFTAFNASSAVGGTTPATSVTNFTATASTYTPSPLSTTSDQIVVYRAVPASPGLYGPAKNSTLTSSSVTFAWDSSTAGAGPDYGATAYWLDVGSTQGANNYYSSGALPTTTFSQTVSRSSHKWQPRLGALVLPDQWTMAIQRQQLYGAQRSRRDRRYHLANSVAKCRNHPHRQQRHLHLERGFGRNRLLARYRKLRWRQQLLSIRQSRQRTHHHRQQPADQRRHRLCNSLLSRRRTVVQRRLHLHRLQYRGRKRSHAEPGELHDFARQQRNLHLDTRSRRNRLLARRGQFGGREQLLSIGQPRQRNQHDGQ